MERNSKKLMAEEEELSGGGGEEVMSEVHLGLGCPPGVSGPHTSYLTISIPQAAGVEYSKCCDLFKEKMCPPAQTVLLDEDGDLIVTRRKSNHDVSSHSYRITIQHSITSSIPSVGLQVWRAELVLCDFMLHKMFTSSELGGTVCLELGAGTGLVGILLARVAKTVFLTDRGDEILHNCAMNVHLNSGLFGQQAAVHVRELNWMDLWPPKIVPENFHFPEVVNPRYAWTSPEVEEAQGASVLVAADVIYSDDLTDAFFTCLDRLTSQSPEKVLYLALEKRYNFSIDDLDVVANGYSHFRSYIRDEDAEETDRRSVDQRRLPRFAGKCIDISRLPQYIREYERGSDVEVWRIKFNTKESCNGGQVRRTVFADHAREASTDDTNPLG